MNGQALWFFSRSTGVMALLLLTAVLVLGMATSGRAGSRALPPASVLHLHRTLTLLATVFVAVHIATAVADEYVPLDVWHVFWPFGSRFDPLWTGLGAAAVDIGIAVTVTSLLRRRLPLKVWRAVHLLAYAMWPLALAHGWGSGGGDGSTGWMVALQLTCLAVVLFSAVYWRLLPASSADGAARARADATHPLEPAPRASSRGTAR